MIKYPTYKQSVFYYTLLFFIITYWFFSKSYLHPTYFFNTTGDGIKNNCTYLYHILYDADYWQYNGMNYPFGENIIYIDCQPLLSNTVKFITSIFPFVKNHLQVIYNYFMFFTWWLGGIALLKLFRKMNLQPWLAIVFSVCIILMNPQINRLLCGHHGLSHPLLPFIFLWWFDIIHEQENKYIISLKISAMVFVLAFLHLYQFAYAILVCSIFIFFFAFSHKKIKDKIFAFSILLFIQIIIPYYFVKLSERQANYVLDRPDAPSRFFMDSVTPWSVFLHPFSEVGKWIYCFFNKLPDPNHEVHAYAGFFAPFFLVLFLICFIHRFVLRKTNLWNTLSKYQKIVFAVAIISLVVAMGLPFTLPGFNQYYYYTGMFRQVRSIGRIAVVFYFAIQIVGVTWLNERIINIKNKTAQRVSVGVFIIIMMVDMLYFLSIVRFYPKNLEKIKSSTTTNLLNTKFSSDAFQAIITNPYYYVGAENSCYFNKKDALRQCLQLSIQTGLPSLNSMLCRNSLKQTIYCTQLAHPLFKMPLILAVLPNQKPFILLESKGYLGETNYSLDYVSNAIPTIYENDEIILKQLKIADFKKAHFQLIDSIQKIYQNQKTYQKLYAFYNSNTIQKNKIINKINFNLDEHLNRNIVVSFRIKTENIRCNCIIKQFDKNKLLISSYEEYTGDWTEQIDEDETMFAMPFKLENKTAVLQIELHNTEFDLPFNCINALLYEQHTHHFIKQKNELIYNNYRMNDFNALN